MNKHDYDFSKHITVPDAWIEKALAIPADHPEKPRLLSLTSRRITAAAAVVLVVTLSLSLYLAFGRPAVPVAPSPDEPTKTAVPTAPADSTHPGVPPTPSATELPTDASAGITETQRPSDSAAVPTEHPANSNPGHAPTKPPVVSPTQGESRQPSAQPTTNSAEPPTTAPTERTPLYPTDAPTEESVIPAQDAYPEPTTEDPAMPTEYENASELATPDEADPEDPSDDPEPFVPNVEPVLEITIPFPDASDAQEIDTKHCDYYCRIYDPDGALVGDSDLYAADHQASFTYRLYDWHLCLRYSLSLSPYVDELPSPSDRFTYVFYDSSGNTVASGTKSVIYNAL